MLLNYLSHYGSIQFVLRFCWWNRKFYISFVNFKVSIRLGKSNGVCDGYCFANLHSVTSAPLYGMHRVFCTGMLFICDYIGQWSDRWYYSCKWRYKKVEIQSWFGQEILWTNQFAFRWKTVQWNSQHENCESMKIEHILDWLIAFQNYSGPQLRFCSRELVSQYRLPFSLFTLK